MYKKIIFSLYLIMSFRANATIEIRSNFMFSNLTTSVADLSVKTYNGLYLGIDSFKIGAVYMYSPMHSYVSDEGYGVAIRFGDRQFFEMATGVFRRSYLNLYGRGYFISLISGFDFGSNFGISIPITIKNIQSGSLDKRLVVNVLPFMSWRLSF